MLCYVAPGNPVRDILKTEGRNEPSENRWLIARRDSLIRARLTNFCVDLIEERQRDPATVQTERIKASASFVSWKVSERGSQPR